MKNSIIKNYAYNLIFQIVTLIAPIITMPYVSRILEPDGIGAYSFAASIVSYFVLFGNFGIDTYGKITIASNRDNKLHLSNDFWGIYISRAILMTACLILYFIVVSFFSNQKYLFYILAVTILASLIDISWFYQGIEEFGLIAVRNTLIRIVSVILIFVLVKDKNDLLIYAAILNGTTLLGNLSLYIRLKSNLVHINMADILIFPHIKNSFKYLIPTIATSIYTVLDKSMIGLITHSDLENGYYEQAHKIGLTFVTVLTSLNTVVLPRMTNYYSNDNQSQVSALFDKLVQFIFFAGLPMCFGLIAIAPRLIPWYLGEGYSKCVPLLQLFSLLIIIIGLNNAVGQQILQASKRQWEYNKGVLIGAICNLLMNSVLIYLYQSIGAAIASVISEFIILSVFIHYAKDSINIKILFIDSEKIIISSLLMFLIAVVLNRILPSQTVWMFIIILIGIIIYLLLLIVLKDKFLLNIFHAFYRRNS